MNLCMYRISLRSRIHELGHVSVVLNSATHKRKVGAQAYDRGNCPMDVSTYLSTARDPSFWGLYVFAREIVTLYINWSYTRSP